MLMLDVHTYFIHIIHGHGGNAYLRDLQFVDYDGEAEIGCAFEKAVFGGVVEDWRRCNV